MSKINIRTIQSKRYFFADWGRKEMDLAEAEMPGLMSFKRRIWR